VNRENKFGKRIRELRDIKGWSQEDLAEASGLHRTYISGIERGARNPTLSVIGQLADALNVSPRELFIEEKRSE
jgi:transcriptional regulator with XRE-family HTH domain